MKPYFFNDFAAFVGIDWADKKHDICLQAKSSTKGDVIFDKPSSAG